MTFKYFIDTQYVLLTSIYYFFCDKYLKTGHRKRHYTAKYTIHKISAIMYDYWQYWFVKLNHYNSDYIQRFVSAITTVEGLLERTVAGLMQDQPVRIHMDPEGAKMIDDYVAKINELRELKKSFTLVRILLYCNSFSTWVLKLFLMKHNFHLENSS